MRLTQEQVNSAIQAGLAITNPESEAPVPMKYAAGALILHQLLMAIGAGQVALQSVDAPPGETPPDGKPPAGGSKKKAKKKVAKKKASRRRTK